MKNIESMENYCNHRSEHYIVALTSDEFYYIKTALREYVDALKDEIDTYEWLDNPSEHKRLEIIEKLSDELDNLPF